MRVKLEVIAERIGGVIRDIPRDDCFGAVVGELRQVYVELVDSPFLKDVGIRAT